MEESQVKPDKLEQSKPLRNEKGQLIPGQPSLNPNGRPKGQSLKEFWRQRFQEMTEDEKIAFTAKVGHDVVWKMAEGNPKNDLDLTAKVTMSDLLKDLEHGDREQTASNEAIGQVVEIAALIQDSGQEEKPDNIPEEQSPAALPQPQVVEKYNPEESATGLHN